MIEELINLNKTLIKKYRNNDEKLTRQLLIEQLLKNKKCFFKLKIDVAYQILRDLEIEDNNIRNTYCKLIDIINY